ncbi:hypothetical protein [Streptomyces sp. SM8]|uniref:hypothetical protein n=1 Tax=Streptomyces sp. SM8 TaxID=1195457 RepID=UPI0002FD73BB|nr:hypothetical protein [Streptomyces sp. SM8]
MSDLPADLPCLHVLRMWHAMWLARIDKAIATAEQREAETRRGAEVRPPLAGARVRPLDTEQARQAPPRCAGVQHVPTGHGPRPAVGQRAFLQRG